MNKESINVLGTSETKYFYELTPEKILQAVETFTSLPCTGRCLALNSFENRVYEVEIDEGDKKFNNPSERYRIVKFYRPGRWTAEQILEEHRFLLDLAELEIPVVAPLSFGNGETLLKMSDSDIYCAVFPKIGGRSPDELSSEQLPLVGRLLARMHNAGATRKAEHRVRITAESYGRTNLKFLIDSKTLPRDIAQTYIDLVNEICDLSEPLILKADYQRIHGDCHFGNLLWGKDGPFWVDFDDMLNGPCVQDLWLIIPGRDDYSKNQLSILLEAYEQMRDFDYRSLNLIEPLRALRMIHFSAWIAKRWEDPAFPQAFTNFGTERYWAEQVSQLQEQLEMIRLLDKL